jgi:hypothetical protein
MIGDFDCAAAVQGLEDAAEHRQPLPSTAQNRLDPVSIYHPADVRDSGRSRVDKLILSLMSALTLLQI